MPIQFFHAFTLGMKACHAAQGYISTLPEHSEWTLTVVSPLEKILKIAPPSLLIMTKIF